MRIGGDKEERFVEIRYAEHQSGEVTAFRLYADAANEKVIDLSSFRREMEKLRLWIFPVLPSCTGMMLTGYNGSEDVGVILCGSHPNAVDADPCCEAPAGLFLDEDHKRFARLSHW